MGANNQPIFVGLDIGTSTARCVILSNDNAEGRPSVIGYGSAPNLGMRRGSVVHADDVAEAVVAAVSAAERVSGVRVTSATVNINGKDVAGSDSKGVIAVSGNGRIITDQDRARVEDAAIVVKLPPNREIVQVFAKDYAIDGQSGIKDPVGMSGVRLEVSTQLITASTPSIKNLDLVLEKSQIRPRHHTVSGLAAAEVCMSRQQKEAGTLVIDIGAGTTNLAILEDGEVQHVAVIPIGGSHLTNDLAIGLKTDLDVAEQIKLKYATVDESVKGSVKVKNGHDQLEFSLSEIAMITNARMEELFEFVDKELARVHKARKLPGGVVLSGGGSKVAGLVDFVKDQLNLPARLGSAQAFGGLGEAVSDSAFFTATGLALLDMMLPRAEVDMTAGIGDKLFGVFDNIKNRFR